MKRIIAIIPARYASSRFPGKPLADILGKSMIRRVYERVCAVDSFIDVIVATDDERIKAEVDSFGGHAVLTGECSCGTERVYEAVKDIPCDIVINVQGDEPLIQKEMIQDLLGAFEEENVTMATLKKRIALSEDIHNPNIVKVVTDKKDNAIYFSRCAIPYNRDGTDVIYYRHIGLYGYTKDFLREYVTLSETALEKCENLEQLRVLENGYDIRVKETQYESISVDLPEHIEQVEKVLMYGKQI